MIARHLGVVVLGVTLVLAGCTSGTDDQAAQLTTTTTAAPTTTSEPVRAECADVADAARGLATEVGRLTTGGATVDAVRTSASELADALAAARATLAADAQADLDRAGQALERIQDALAAQPVDTAALRTATAELVAALGDAADVCAAGSATPAPTS